MEEPVGVGQLRDDFVQLFAGRVLHVPPLRERPEDIALLARHFVELLNQRMARRTAVTGVDDAAVEALERYSWPGNVRELFDAIESAFVGGRSAPIRLDDLPGAISGINSRNQSLPTISFETFADAERGVLKRALEITGGNRSAPRSSSKFRARSSIAGSPNTGSSPSIRENKTLASENVVLKQSLKLFLGKSGVANQALKELLFAKRRLIGCVSQAPRP